MSQVLDNGIDPVVTILSLPTVKHKLMCVTDTQAGIICFILELNLNFII